MSSCLHDQHIRLFAFEVDADLVRRREELEELVTGEPLTIKSDDGADRPALVIVPIPALTHTQAVPFHCKI